MTPYKMIYVPAKSNMKLPVSESLPNGFVEENNFVYGVRTARNAEYMRAYFCPHCDGWIRGNAEEYHENNINESHLAGRSGTSYCCIRCGREISFFGTVS